MPHRVTRRELLRYVGAGTTGTVATSGPAAAVVADAGGGGSPAVAPPFAGEFALAPLAPAEFPTAVRFGPGDGSFGEAGAGDDGPDLYAATLPGDVVRYHLAWTDAGPTVRDQTVAAGGFRQPLGVAFLERGPSRPLPRPHERGRGPKDDALVVSDSHENERTGRTDGTVVLIESDGERRTLIDGLPNGQHNTNHLAFGPDDRLYITNGNATDDGCAGGPPEVPPYSGAVLAVDVEELEDDPAVLRWFDAEDRIAPDQIADDPVNDGFDEKVDVVAHGFRNVYGLAFDGDGVLHTAMNGSDDPASPDAFYRLDELEDGEGVDYRFPYCFDEGDVGATGGEVGLRPNPAAPGHDCHVFDAIRSLDDLECGDDEHPTADAILGWHACATGLDFPSEGRAAFPDGFQTDAFVGECGTFSPLRSGERTLESTDGRNTGHSVAHVRIDDGDVSRVRDFLTGLSLPTDVHFGPRGAMYVADLGAVYRVRPAA